MSADTAVVRSADLEEFELIRTFQQAGRRFGLDPRQWTDGEWAEYEQARLTVAADYPQNHAPREAS